MPNKELPHNLDFSKINPSPLTGIYGGNSEILLKGVQAFQHNEKLNNDHSEQAENHDTANALVKRESKTKIKQIKTGLIHVFKRGE